MAQTFYFIFVHKLLKYIPQSLKLWNIYVSRGLNDYSFIYGLQDGYSKPKYVYR